MSALVGRRDPPAAAGALRVTHVVFDLHGGGLESLVAAMAARFAESPIAMSVITLSGRAGRLGEQTRPLLDQYHVLRPVPVLSMLLPLALVRRIRMTSPDVVHLHSGAWYKSAVAARLAGVRRVIYTEHGREHDDPALSKWLDRRAAACTSLVVAVSRRLHRYLTSVVGLAEGKVCTIENGVDTTLFAPGDAPADLRASLGIPDDAYVLGSVGRLEPVKAYDRLIEAVATLNRDESLKHAVYLVLCGEGSQRAMLEGLARSSGVGERVKMVGWTSQPLDFYRLFDVFALTSLSEGMSVSMLEAMACGTPPLVTDVGGNADLLGPELTDQLVPPADPTAYVGALAELLRSSERRARTGELARHRVVQRYSLSRMLEEYERVYRGHSPTNDSACE